MDPLQVYVTPLMSPIKRWLAPVTTILALISILTCGTDVLWENSVVSVNALFVANYFKCRLNGETASYLLGQVPPDDDDAVLGDWIMVFVAAFTVLTPIYLIASGFD